MQRRLSEAEESLRKVQFEHRITKDEVGFVLLCLFDVAERILEKMGPLHVPMHPADMADKQGVPEDKQKKPKRRDRKHKSYIPDIDTSDMEIKSKAEVKSVGVELDLEENPLKKG